MKMFSKTSIFITLAVLSVLFFTRSAIPITPPTGPSVSVGMLNLNLNSKVEDRYGSVGLSPSVGIGCNINPKISLSAYFDYWEICKSRVMYEEEITNKLSNLSITFFGLYHIQSINSPFSPYIGLGPCYHFAEMKVESSYIGDTVEIIGRDSRNPWGFDITVGVNYPIAPRVALDVGVGYSYVPVDDWDMNKGGSYIYVGMEFYPFGEGDREIGESEIRNFKFDEGAESRPITTDELRALAAAMDTLGENLRGIYPQSNLVDSIYFKLGVIKESFLAGNIQEAKNSMVALIGERDCWAEYMKDLKDIEEEYKKCCKICMGKSRWEAGLCFLGCSTLRVLRYETAFATYLKCCGLK